MPALIVMVGLVSLFGATAARAGGATKPVSRWGAPIPLGKSHITPEQRKADLQTTHNWAGYIATGPTFTQAHATWVVPTVARATQPTESATWVGVDGSTNANLIQAGTEQDSDQNGTAYFAWYEILPAPEMQVGSVFPGDVMDVSVEEESPGLWSISVTDKTTGNSTTGQADYTGPGSSAEWIEEAPSDRFGNIETLANFGTVQINDATAQGSGAAQTLQGVAMTDANNSVIATPSSVVGHSFTVSYGSVAQPPTSVPPTTTPPVSCPAGSGTVPSNGAPAGIAATTINGCRGYWVTSTSGTVRAFGAAALHGDLSGQPHAPIVDIAATPDGQGYWLVAQDGSVYPFGDAQFFGDMRGRHLNQGVIAMSPTTDGQGYWLVAGDGGIFNFGDAHFYGSTGNLHLNQPVVGIAPSPGGTGYWLVASDGGLFTFGTAPFLGSMGGTHLNKPVVGMTTSAVGAGYRMVASDGGLFSFGAPFYGSLGNNPPPTPVITMAPTPDNQGYYMMSADGSIFAFGTATYLGRTA